MLFYNYPYTNFNDLNLDWIIKKVKELDQVVDDFIAYNKVTFAGDWDGSPYPAWTVVDDGQNNGYLSIKAVPANVPLSNTEYWTQVASYSSIYSAFNQRISALEGQMTNVNQQMTNVNQQIANLRTDVDNANLYIAPTQIPLTGTGTGTPTSNTLTIWKHGHTVTMMLDCCLAATGSTTVATIPAAYRPPATLTQVIPTYAGVGSDYQYIIISSTGTLSIYCDVIPSRLLITISWTV